MIVPVATGKAYPQIQGVRVSSLGPTIGVVGWSRTVADGIVRWCATATDPLSLRAGILDRLGTTVPFDGAFFATVDPATLLYTSAVRRDMPAEASPAFIRTELGDHDVNQLRDLARAPSPVGWLDGATSGERMSSARFREAMRPFGLGDELRVALRVDGWCWGLLCLHRSETSAGFEPDEAALLARLGPYLAQGLRRSVVAERVVENWTPDGPGVAVIRSDLSIETATATALGWLEELAQLDAPRTPQLPTVVLTVIEQLADAPHFTTALLPRARVRAPSGRWLVVHAANLDGDDGRVAVIVEPAAPAVLAPVVVAAYGLTAREAEVAQRLLAGLARKTVATELRISLHTVNDHLKAVFDKVGVSSAGELRARIFTEHFTPKA